MAEYIEKEPLLRKAKGLQGSCFSSPLIVAAIETADVVPKSEIERLEHILECYALQYGTVVDQTKVIDKAKVEVAGEIFEEIEKFMDETDGLSVFMTRTEFFELKKKYTEGE